MTAGAKLSPDTSSVTVSVPLTLRRHGGRKLVVTPEGAPDWAPRQREINSTLVKALARGFRWRRLIEDGVYGTIAELAAAEWINVSYVSRILRLTLLAPEIVEAVQDGRHGPDLATARLFRPFPVEWRNQPKALQGP